MFLSEKLPQMNLIYPIYSKSEKYQLKIHQNRDNFKIWMEIRDETATQVGSPSGMHEIWRPSWSPGGSSLLQNCNSVKTVSGTLKTRQSSSILVIRLLLRIHRPFLSTLNFLLRFFDLSTSSSLEPLIFIQKPTKITWNYNKAQQNSKR